MSFQHISTSANYTQQWVQVLQKDYNPASIETFLKALCSQEPEQIEKTPQALLRKYKSQIFSLFSQNKPENCPLIFQTHFSLFLHQKVDNESNSSKENYHK
ncbi:MAG: hypothetical protein EBQ95_03330 [Gammaproteobacteria bacterium]|nr:hypothetical protein [Gammaproteobacteria bacterium]